MWTKEEYRDKGGFVERLRTEMANSKYQLPDSDLIFLRRTHNRVAFDFSAWSPRSLIDFFRRVDIDANVDPVFTVIQNGFDRYYRALVNFRIPRPPTQVYLGPTLGRAIGKLDDILRIDDRSDGPQYGGYRWAVVKAGDIDFLINDKAFSEDWANLRAKDSIYAERLKQELLKLHDILSHLTI
jgi:hypothetical protein